MLLFIFLRKISKTGRNVWKSNFRDWCVETLTKELDPRNDVMELGFSSGDDYPVSNIDDPVRLSNGPVRVATNLFRSLIDYEAYAYVVNLLQ